MALNTGNVGGNQLRLNERFGLNGLNLGGLDPNSPEGLSLDKLLKEIEKLVQGQAQGGGGPQQAAGGAPPQAGGADQAGGDSNFSLAELMDELRKRAQQNQQQVANALRQNPGVANALQGGMPLEIGAGGGLGGGGGGGVGAFA